MADDWDDDSTHTSSAPVNQWADEDVDQDPKDSEDVADAWDAEPEEKTKPTTTAATATVRNKATAKQKLKEKEEADRREAQREAAKFAADPSNRAPSKAEIEEAQKARDAQLAGDLFGVTVVDERKIAAVDNTTHVSTDEVVAVEKIKPAGETIQNFPLNSDADFDRFAKLINTEFKKLTPNTKVNGLRVLSFMKKLVESNAEIMRLEDLNELKRVVTAKHTELTNKAKAPKKGAKAKPQLAVAGKGATSSRGRNNYGDDDDYEDDGDFL